MSWWQAGTKQVIKIRANVIYNIFGWHQFKVNAARYEGRYRPKEGKQKKIVKKSKYINTLVFSQKEDFKVRNDIHSVTFVALYEIKLHNNLFTALRTFHNLK